MSVLSVENNYNLQYIINTVFTKATNRSYFERISAYLFIFEVPTN